VRRRVGLFLVLLALVVVAVACGGDDESSEGTSTSTTSTTAADTPPDTSVTVGIICTTAEEASQSTVEAWGADDQAAAARCSTDAVVDVLFRTSGVGNSWFFQGCDRADPGVPICAFSYEGGAAFFTVEGTEAAGWKATKLEFLAD
jgi:hypothetical protein